MAMNNNYTIDSPYMDGNTMRSVPYKFMFWQVLENEEGVLYETNPKDLEKDFAGLIFKEAKNIEAKGKTQNVYIEEFAESNEAKVYTPEEATFKSHDVTITLYAFGDRQREVLDEWEEYIAGKRLAYWDGRRKKKLYLILVDAITPNKDEIKHENGYIEKPYKFKTWKLGERVESVS